MILEYCVFSGIRKWMPISVDVYLLILHENMISYFRIVVWVL